jgi:mRNA interferase HicA
MKRRDLIRQIEQNGCVLIRPGGRHDWYQNRKTGACHPFPATVRSKEHLARHILKELED